jgi:hypothetical protein
MSFLFRVLAVMAITLLGCVSQAQFVISPQGRSAGSVTPKTLKADFNVYPAYATARLELTFETDPNWANEVDFMMRLPEGAEATGFAYWFQDEYVVAKTVAKERAAAIYRLITERQRDPALVEMVGRRQFRVRIAPVDSTKDLRVEIKLVLRQSAGAHQLPLRALFKDSLAAADFTLTLPNEPGWVENWGLSRTIRGNRAEVKFSSKPWRARRDWRVSKPESKTQVSIGRPPTGDGTLIVAYTAKENEKGLSLTGTGLHSIYPKVVKTLRKGDTATFTARIAGKAPQTLALRIGKQSWTQPAPARPFEERSAVVLWGATHVDQLKNRKQIKKWGINLGIPTKETSWLAVPKAEREALEEARLTLLAQNHYLNVAKFGWKSRSARETRSAYEQAVRAYIKVRGDQGQQGNFLNRGFSSAISLLREQYAKAVRLGVSFKVRDSFAQGVERLASNQKRRFGHGPELRARLLAESVDSLIEEIVLGKTPESSTTELRRLIAAQRTQSGSSEIPYQFRQYLNTIAAQNLQISLDFPEYELQPAAVDRAKRLMPLFGAPATLMEEARLHVIERDFRSISTRYRNQMLSESERTNLEWLTQVSDQLTQRAARYGVNLTDYGNRIAQYMAIALIPNDPYYPSGPDYLTREFKKPVLAQPAVDFLKVLGVSEVELYRIRFEYALSVKTRIWQDYYYQTRRDPSKVTNAKARVEEMIAVMQLPMPTGKRSLRDQFVESVRERGPAHPETARIRKLLERESPSFEGRRYKEYRADVLLARLELDSLSWRTLTPEEQAKRAEVEKRERDLSARMGDPLLQVEAGPDAAVTAKLPDGQIVRLTWNASAQLWQHRFDLPPGTPEGEVKIPIWIRHGDGRMETREFRVQADQSAPSLKAKIQDRLLTVETSAEVARVNVSFASGQRLTVLLIQQASGQKRWQVKVPSDAKGDCIVIATDRAHNRAEVRLSLSP